MAKCTSPWLSRACRDCWPLSSSPSSSETPLHQDSNVDNLIVPELQAVCLVHFQQTKNMRPLHKAIQTHQGHILHRQCISLLCVEELSSWVLLFIILPHYAPVASVVKRWIFWIPMTAFPFLTKVAGHFLHWLVATTALPKTWCKCWHGKQLKNQDKSKPCINILAEIISWLFKKK